MYTEDLLQENFQTTAQNKKPLIVKKTKQKQNRPSMYLEDMLQEIFQTTAKNNKPCIQTIYCKRFFRQQQKITNHLW